MISFNDGSAGEHAVALARFLTKNNLPTFCTRIYCPATAGDWRDATLHGVKTCKIYIPLLTNGWQTSPECQWETGIIKQRIAKKEVKVIPVYYNDFDKTYDDKTDGHDYKFQWNDFQSVWANDEDWMNRIMNLLVDGGVGPVAEVKVQRYTVEVSKVKQAEVKVQRYTVEVYFEHRENLFERTTGGKIHIYVTTIGKYKNEKVWVDGTELNRDQVFKYQDIAEELGLKIGKAGTTQTDRFITDDVAQVRKALKFTKYENKFGTRLENEYGYKWLHN